MYDYKRCNEWIGRLGLMGLGIVLTASGVSADEPRAVQTGDMLRASLGYDPVTLAALGVSAAQHASIASHTIQYAGQRKDELAPLVDQYREAQVLRGRSPHRGKRLRPAARVVEEANVAIRNQAADLDETLRKLLTEEQRTVLSRAAANAGLDPMLRLLPLTDQQRSRLQEAAQVRDGVVRNPYRWHRASLVNQARRKYDSRVDATLTATQKQSVRQYQKRVKENLGSIIRQERAVKNMASQGADASRHWLALPMIGAVLQPKIPSLTNWFQNAIQHFDFGRLAWFLSVPAPVADSGFVPVDMVVVRDEAPLEDRRKR